MLNKASKKNSYSFYYTPEEKSSKLGLLYILNQKFDLTRISVLRDMRKIWKKSPISKMSTTFIMHNNNANW